MQDLGQVVGESHPPFGSRPVLWNNDAAHSAVRVEEIAAMAWMTVTINPALRPIGEALRDKHHFRKHGPKAYYGQG